MRDRDTLTHRGRLGVALGLAVLGSGLGLAVGWSLMAQTAASLGLPLVAFLMLSRLPMRAVVVSGIAVLLGSVTISLQPDAGIAWGDAALLGAMVPVALVGSRWAGARQAVTSASTIPDPTDGRWLTVVVTGQGPAPMAGKPAVLPRLPKNDPERRRLSRRVERKRELVGAGMED